MASDVDLRFPRAKVESGSEADMGQDAAFALGDEVHAAGDPEAALAGAPLPQRSIVQLDWAKSEINNGGCQALLYGTSGGFLADLPAAADLIGAAEYRELFVALADAVGPLPADWTERELHVDTVVHSGTEQGEAIRERLGELDDRFYALDGTEGRELAAYFWRYVNAHPEMFFAD